MQRLFVFRIVSEVHVTLLKECVVHSINGTQVLRSLSLFASSLYVIPQQLFVIGVSTVFDDSFGSLYRTLSTKVGITLFGNDISYALCYIVDISKSTSLIGNVTFYDTDDLMSIDFDIRLSDTVGYACDRYRLTMRRV